MKARQDNELGHVTVLMIGYVVLVLLVVTVVAAAGSLYLGQKRLLSLADSAALAAADTFVLSGGNDTADPGTLLTQQAVMSAAQGYLAGVNPPTGMSSIALAPGTGAPDGHTAQVTLTGVVHPLFINFLVPEGIPITVTSTARANLAL